MMMGRHRAAGFTYLTALFMIAIMAAGLGLVGQMWETESIREREAELLYVGHQYRLAIQRYVVSGPGLYPRTLDDLLKDPRSPSTRRHLRRLYPDPITRSSEWGIIKAPDGGIMGVHSRSEDAPLKVANFRTRDQDFASATKYSDWKFFYAPKPAGQQQQLQQKPGAAVPAPGAPGMPGAAPGTPPMPGTIPMPGAAPGPGASPMPGSAPAAGAPPMPGSVPSPFAPPPSSAGNR
jgi:type II secretory pathway pseudopilin PulG